MRFAVFFFAAAAYGQALDWNARWDNYIQRTYDWKRVGMVAAETAFDQTFRLNKCGRPPYCFPNEIGGALVRRTARTTVEWGAGALLGEDIRRTPSGQTGFRRRFTYALIHAPLAKEADGSWGPAYSRYAGSLAGATVGTAWCGRPITMGRLSEQMGWSFAAYFQDALWTEFEPDVKRMARRFVRRVGIGGFVH